MKKQVGIVWVAMSLITSTVYANQNANLNIKITGAGKNNTYFLCVEGVGCVSMFAAAHGKRFPLTPGKVDRIFLVNTNTLRTYFQALPASCQVNIRPEQTFTVRGKITNGKNDKVYIKQLTCEVA